VLVTHDSDDIPPRPLSEYGALAMKPCNLRYRKEFPPEQRKMRSIFLVGHFDETCFSIDRTRPADRVAASTSFAAETMPTLTLSTPTAARRRD
jgi:hypothetical protein